MMIHRRRGFRIRRKLAKVFQWMTRGWSRNRRSNPTRHRPKVSSPGAKIMRLGQCISRGAKRLCNFRSNIMDRGYVRVGQGSPVRNDVPKGHLAVCVEQPGNGSCRVVVPVIYINHPLFGELLREAEQVHGYDHPRGTITLPCEFSEFENIQSKIAESGRYRKRDSWRDMVHHRK